MSLCPNYCECKPCKHGNKLCSEIGCTVCAAEYQRKLDQQEHEASVKRQQAKLRKAPWRKEAEELAEDLRQIGSTRQR